MHDKGVARLGHDLIRAWNAHDAERIAGLHAADCSGVDVGRSGQRRGREGVRRAAEAYLRAFPDLQLTLEDTLVDGNRMVVTWTARGTQTGSVMRIPPTHRPVEVRGLCVLTVEAGMISHAVHHWDVAGMLRHLGLLPDLHEVEDDT